MVPMYEPSRRSCRANRWRRSILTSGPVVAPHVTNVPRSLQRPHALVPRGGAYVLHHNVNSFLVRDLSNLFRNLLLVVVDAVIGSKGMRFLQLLFVAGGCDHTAMKQFRNLDCGDANSRAAA